MHIKKKQSINFSRLSTLLFCLILTVTFYSCKSSYCHSCKLIGEQDFDRRFIATNLKNLNRLVPDKIKYYGDTVYMEIEPMVFDTSSLDGIYKYRYRYKHQKKLRFIDSSCDYNVYQYFFIENKKIIFFWRMSKNRKNRFLSKKYDSLCTKYGAENIKSIYDQLKR